MITGTEPPSADQAAPATFDARSEQRNAITVAISTSVPIRPSGGLERVPSSTSSRVNPVRFAISSASPPSRVQSSPSTGPGVTAFTSTPLDAQASANTRDNQSRAAL